jgi:hypothetical protein
MTQIDPRHLRNRRLGSKARKESDRVIAFDGSKFLRIEYAARLQVFYMFLRSSTEREVRSEQELS